MRGVGAGRYKLCQRGACECNLKGQEDSLADFFEAFEKMMSQSPLLKTFDILLIFD
jgi:hypothetical protein